MQRAYAPRGLGFLPKLAFIITVGMITAVASYQAAAIDVFTDPVGFYQVPIITNSDTVITIPFTQIPQFLGTVATAPGASSQLSISGSPGWTPTTQWATLTPNGFAPYYVFVRSGAQAGAFFIITNNDASVLSVDVHSPENMSGIVAGDTVSIIPFWSLGTVFPGGAGINVTTSTLSHKTEIQFPNMATVGPNLGFSAIYFFYNSHWRKSGGLIGTSFDDAVILPDQYVLARQNTPGPTTTNTMLGKVPLETARIPLYANLPASNLKQDNALAIYRPAVQTLYQSGLSNVIAVTTSTLSHKDEVQVFDNTLTQKPKGPSAIYFFYNNGWRQSGQPIGVDYGNSNIFQVATGFFVRRATNTATTVLWVNQPNY